MRTTSWVQLFTSALLVLGLAFGSTAQAQETELVRLRASATSARRDYAAQRALGEGLLRAGRYREATQQFQAAARLQRGSLEAQFDVARVAFASRDHRASEAACRAMARTDRNAPLARVCQARADLVQNRSARAFDEVNVALAANPNLYEALYALGEAHRLRAAVSDAESAYQRAIAQRATAAEPHLGLGRLYLAANRREDALRSLRRALELDATEPEIQLELGRLLANEEGRALLERAASARAAWPEAHCALGDVLFREGQFAPAEAAYRSAIAARPDHEPAHLGLGRALAAAGDLPGAEASLRRAIEIVQNDPIAWLSLADLLARSERTEEAYEAYRRTFSFDTRNAEPMLRASRLALAQNRDVLASGFLDGVLRVQPENGEALALYGDVMTARRDRTQARTYYEHALQAGVADRARVEAALRQ